MNILHLLSQTEVTGAEVYATTLSQHQFNKSHSVWIMSDTLTTPTDASYIPLALDKRTSLQRIKNIIAVKRIIKKYQIDVVHAHSRASIWIGFFATWRTKIPLISTIHGRQKSSVSKRLFDQYGDRVITVCRNLTRQLLDAVNINPQKIVAIPNGIKFSSTHPSNPKNPILSVVGRTTGPKGDILASLIESHFPLLLEQYPTLTIQLMGGDTTKLSSQVQTQLSDLMVKFPNRIDNIGFVNNLADYLQDSTVVIGAGRVAIESLAMGTPVIAIGEACYMGLVTTENLDGAIASNFGDMATVYHAVPITFEQLEHDIDRALNQNLPLNTLTEKIRLDYDANTIADKIEDLYQSEIIRKHHKQHIPVLMYHKVLPTPEISQHKTYVTCQQFAQHMQYLQRSHYTPITFKEYFDYREHKKPLSSFPKKPIIITFDDGYKNNLENALPILQKHGFNAVLFALGNTKITTNQWDTAHGEPEHPLMSTDELKILADHNIEIGAHSLTHPDLTKLSSDDAYQEIFQSKLNLETMMGQDIISFAYPYGYYNDEVKKLVKKAGFKCAVATDTGGLLIEDDLFAVFRVNIMPRDKKLPFWKKTQPWYRKRYWKKRGK